MKAKGKKDGKSLCALDGNNEGALLVNSIEVGTKVDIFVRFQVSNEVRIEVASQKQRKLLFHLYITPVDGS